MIQAPNTTYLPQQDAMTQQPDMAQQTGMPQQPDMQQAQQPQGGFYNYPTTSCYAPSPQPKFNGVELNIIGASGMSSGTGTAPAAQSAMPYPPGYYQVNTPTDDPQKKTFNQPLTFNPAQPYPQPMVPPPMINPGAQPGGYQPQQPAIQQPTQQFPGQSLQEFTGGLASDDLQTQMKTMETLADKIKNDPQSSTMLQDSSLYEALLGIIAKDTSQMEPPTEQQTTLRQQLQEGKTLTPEQEAEAQTPSPMEAAEMNKQCALYTIAYLQSALADQVAQQGRQPLNITEIPAIEQVVQTLKEDPNPMVREAALNSLSHIARPEYKAELTKIFDLAKQDAEQNVRDQAQVVSDKLAQM